MSECIHEWKDALPQGLIDARSDKNGRTYYDGTMRRCKKCGMITQRISAERSFKRVNVL